MPLLSVPLLKLRPFSFEILSYPFIQIRYVSKEQSDEGGADVLGELEHETHAPEEVVPVDQEEDRGDNHQCQVGIC